MKTQEQVERKEEFITSPGAVTTVTTATFFDSITESQVRAFIGKAWKTTIGAAWWMGDGMIKARSMRRAVLEKDAAELRVRAGQCTDDEDGAQAARRLNEQADHIDKEGVNEYTREVCRAIGCSESYMRNCVAWATYFEPANRLAGLTPRHHQLAMAATGGVNGDKELAMALLAEAEKKGMSASELRKKVNLENAAEVSDELEIASPTYKEIDAADRWALANVHALDAMSLEVLRAHRTQLDGLRDYIEKVDQLIERRSRGEFGQVAV